MPHHQTEIKSDSAKLNNHNSKMELHNRDHQKLLQGKASSGARMERHSANGHTVKEGPKKAGAGGKGTWGTWKDDVAGDVAEVQE